jgi:predicted RNase H-like HicB family nuclease
MKKYGIIAGIIFFAFLCQFQQLNSQEKTREEKEKELQEAIREQKRMMIERQKSDFEAQKRAREEFEKAMKDLKEKGEGRPFADPFMWPVPGDIYRWYPNGNSEKSTWDISKSIKESSYSREYIFDVEASAKSVVMSVSGDCKEGEIGIKIIKPDGMTFSEIVIDQHGNLNWRKSLNISRTENQDKTGAWTFIINSSKTTGYFKIFFQVN